MERYAQMKKSGVPWVETIPESWNVRRGKTVLTLLSRPTRDEDEIITCFRDGESALEAQILSIMQKSLKTALDMALDDILKDWK